MRRFGIWLDRVNLSHRAAGAVTCAMPAPIRGELRREPAFPIATDFDCCHTTPMLTLAQGVRMRLDTHGAAARITVLEPAVVS